MRWPWLLLLVACNAPGVTEPRPAPPAAAGCRAAGAQRELDFWLGDWEVVIRARQSPDSDEWATARGRNRIASILGGCAVEERFSADGPGKPWAGRSLSRWVQAERRWRQTWVDDSGSYLAFTGGMQGKDMVLLGEPSTRDGKRVQMRMIFTDIAASSLLWRWERTTDDGATWKPMMIIEYRRARQSRPHRHQPLEGSAG